MSWRPALLLSAFAFALCASVATSPAAALTQQAPGAYVVGTYNGRSLRLYVDGRPVSQGQVEGRVDQTASPLEIGAYFGHAIWVGTIDDAAVYDRALAPSVIAHHFRIGATPRGSPSAYSHAVLTTPGLVSYWRLDDHGATARDATGRNPGSFSPGVAHGVDGLGSGEGDSAAVFNGHTGSVRVPLSRSLAFRRSFTLEAWVTTASVGNRAILAHVGSFVLRTDLFGHWSVGIFIHGRYQGVNSPFTALVLPSRAAPKGNGSAAGLIALLALAAAVLAGVALLQRRRPRRSKSTPSTARPTDRLPLMNSMRAIAALLVLMAHAAVFSGLDNSTAVGPYAQHLDVGVAIFFLISGLLLYRPFVVARLRKKPTPVSGAYAWRRFLRIVPAYWLALTAAVILVGTSATVPVLSPVGVPRYYLFAQDYWLNSIGGGLQQAWTLSIEVAFYAFLPVYAWLQSRTRATGPRRVLHLEILGLVLLVAVSEIWKLVVLSGGSQHHVIVTPGLVTLPAFLDQFAVGMGLAVLSAWIEVRARSPRWVSTFDRAPTVAWLVAGVAFWAVSIVVLPTALGTPWTPLEYLGRQWLYAVVALGLLLPAVIGDQRRGVARRILANRTLAWFGLISYGIYLWHITILKELERLAFGGHAAVLGQTFLGWFAAALVLTVLVAAASYYALEEPILSLKRLVGGKRRESATPVEAPATPQPMPATTGVPE